MSTRPIFPKDTSPNAIRRAQQVSGMSLDQAKAALLQSKAFLDTRMSLQGWWQRTLQANGVAATEPLFNIQDVITMSVNAAIANYDATKERLFVDHAIAKARTTGGWRMDQAVQTVLARLFEWLELNKPRALPEIPGGIFAVIPEDIARKINRMALYTAMNVSQFSSVPPPRLKTQLQNAVWAADRDESRKEGLGKQMSFAKIIGRCEGAKLDAIRQEVDRGRGAVCTSFAGAVASILMTGLRDRPYRVEMISGPNHCFCLVNRAVSIKDRADKSGATEMPDFHDWGEGAILIDAWAGAMGHPVFYQRPQDFPRVLQVYLTLKLLQHFDSTKV
ncbi:MAG: hypothetical protein ABI197_02280 [Granulicella sp.]